jgi:hypothetical protein
MNPIRTAAAVFAAVLLAACANTPPSRFYRLSAEAQAGQARSAVSIAVGPVSVPAEIDRPQLVLAVAPNRVEIDEFSRWAGPLREEIARTVAENLSRLLGTPAAWPHPRVAAEADVRVRIDVLRFDLARGGTVALDAAWTVSRAAGSGAKSGRLSAQEPAGAEGVEALVAAQSRLLARLSRDIAADVGAPDPARPRAPE